MADAIQLFNDAWEYTTKETVLKCWLKANCLLGVLQGMAKAKLRSICDLTIGLTGHENSEQSIDLSLKYAVSFEDLERQQEDNALMTCLHSSTSLESQFIKFLFTSSVSKSLACNY